MATLFGMALGGWMSGAIFDHTGSYRAAFLNGLVWNMINATIVLWSDATVYAQIGCSVEIVALAVGKPFQQQSQKARDGAMSAYGCAP